ncbi:aminoglycoside phosphotransferase [Streptomyces sp. NPDC001068]|uniref:aminoglycoside phosphotransferase n=1 Tax=Streptomyces sp. NPDC001068 TaxID=3364544 RepID=UPI003696C4E3
MSSLPRYDYQDLPVPVRRAVIAQTGPVRADRTVTAGRNCAIASVLDTEGGPVFLKGVPLGDPRIQSQRREAAINPHTPSSCPRLLWSTDAFGWSLLGYQAVEGRHADYTQPADLGLVLAALEELRQATAPAGLSLTTAQERWGPYADDGDAELFDGQALLHTDLRPDNVLITDSQACPVDWACPTRGAAWIEPFLWALRIMEAGQAVAVAVSWARQLWSWREAAPTALRAFSAAVARLWHSTAAAEMTRETIHAAACAAELRAYLTLESETGT